MLMPTLLSGPPPKLLGLTQPANVAAWQTLLNRFAADAKFETLKITGILDQSTVSAFIAVAFFNLDRLERLASEGAKPAVRQARDDLRLRTEGSLDDDFVAAQLVNPDVLKKLQELDATIHASGGGSSGMSTRAKVLLGLGAAALIAGVALIAFSPSITHDRLSGAKARRRRG